MMAAQRCALDWQEARPRRGQPARARLVVNNVESVS